jgi:hypothetical protein
VRASIASIKPTNNHSKARAADPLKRRHSGALALVAAAIVTVVLPEVFIVVDGIEQVTFAKALDTEHLNDTDPLKLFSGAMVIVAVSELPA